jgi:hypothetical protein
VRNETEGLARSVHTRLIGHSKRVGLDPTLILTRYGIERFLYRLSESPYRDRFILKGALLLMAWLGETLRPTRDVDLLGSGELSDEALLRLFQEVCRQPVTADGMTYDQDSVIIRDIREGDAYGGKRITLTGHLGTGRILVQVDVGIGDVVVPKPEEMDYPVILDFPHPHLMAYPPEAVVSEKLQAMVHLGAANTRLKDFFDIYLLSETHDFKGDRLSSAIRATFERRGTPLPDTLPLALSPAFATAEKERQWRAFLGKGSLSAPEKLTTVIDLLEAFLGPLMLDAATGRRHWAAGGPWTETGLPQ